MIRWLAFSGLGLFFIFPSFGSAGNACNPVPDDVHLKNLDRAFILKVKSRLSLHIPRGDAFDEKRNRFYTQDEGVEILILPQTMKVRLLERLKRKIEFKPGTEISIKSRRFNALDSREVLFAAFVEDGVAPESQPHVFSENLSRRDIPLVFDCFEHTYRQTNAACTVGMLKKALRSKVDVCYSVPGGASDRESARAQNNQPRKARLPNFEAQSMSAEASSESSGAQ